MQWKASELYGMSLTLVLFVTLLMAPVRGYTAPDKVPASPRLVVRIVVEQMRYEMLLRYQDVLGEDGFKRLADEGVVCRNARLDYANGGRSAGFATLTTGTHPSLHGIISDRWFNRLTASHIPATNNTQYQGMGGRSSKAHHAPHNLMTSTTGDELKLISEQSRIYSLALHPVSAVLGAGKLSDGAFWMDDKTGNWMSNSFYLDSLPHWVSDFNDKDLEDIYMNRTWDKLLPDSSYTVGTIDDSDAEEGFLLIYQKQFPYDLRSLRLKSHSYKYLKYTPFGNTYTKDFALALIASEKLGMDEHTDLLNISFSASSYVNELFGPRSMEMEDLYIRLDRQIAHLLDFLDNRFGKDQVLVVLTSERGTADSYEFRKKKGLSTQKFNPDHGLALLQSYLNLVYEPAEWISGYSNKQIYLNHGLIDRKGYDIDRFQEKVARFMVKKSGVAYAVKSTTIQNSSYSGGMMMKIQNSYHPARSGDVFLVLEPGVIEIPERSGSIYSYDTHIPMMWWGNGFPAGVIHQGVNLRDVAPTISYLLDLPYPEASFGSPIIPLIEKDEQ